MSFENDPNLHGFGVIKTMDASRIQFQSAASGLWYDSPSAAGDIACVKFDGVVYGKPDEVVLAEIRVRFDGYVRKFILGTFGLCAVAVAVAWIAQLFR